MPADIEKAMGQFLFTRPFIGFCMSNWIVQKRDNCPTMGIGVFYGRVHLVYNDAWCSSLTKEELMAVLEHELLHLLHGHTYRRGYRDPEMWNVAADLAINTLIQGKLPKGCLWPPDEWKGKATEWIYEKLPQPQRGKGGSSGAPGSGTDWKEGHPEWANGSIDDHSHWGESDGPGVQESVLKKMVGDAQSRSKGQIPSSYQSIVEEIMRPKIKWKDVLKHYIGTRVAQEQSRTWRRRSRRLMATLPSIPWKGFLRKRSVDVMVAVDTSGSVDDDMIKQFFTELEYLAHKMNARVDLIQCDAAVHSFGEYKKGMWKTIKVTGRGGTDARPPFTMLEDKGITPDVMVYFTDGDIGGDYPEAAPDFPVIWMITRQDNTDPTSRNYPPFGKVVYLDLEAQ